MFNFPSPVPSKVGPQAAIRQPANTKARQQAQRPAFLMGAGASRVGRVSAFVPNIGASGQRRTGLFPVSLRQAPSVTRLALNPDDFSADPARAPEGLHLNTTMPAALAPNKASDEVDGAVSDPTLRAVTDLSLLFSKVSQMMRWEANTVQRECETATDAAQTVADENAPTEQVLNEWLQEFPTEHSDPALSAKEDPQKLPQWDADQTRKQLEQTLEEIYSLTFNAALAAAFLSVKAYLTHAPLNPDLVKMTRWLMDRLNALAFNAPPGVAFEPADIPGTEAEWVFNDQNRDSKNLVVFVPGGCYLFETPHKQVLGRMVQSADTRALKLTIPTVLEAPYPAQMNVVAQALDHLLETQQAEIDNVYLMGDSAGGHAIMSYVADRALSGKPVPNVILISPWTDFTLSGESLSSNRERDHFIPPERMPEIVNLMKGETPADDPRLSPAVSLTRVHPDHKPRSAFIVCSDTEVLRDDSTRLADRLEQVGWTVNLNVYKPSRDHEVLPHAFAAVPDMLPQGRHALSQMADFVDKRAGH